MPNDRATSMAEALKRFLDERGLAKRVGQMTALEAWPTVVGCA